MLTSRRDFLCTASAAAIAGLSAREVLAAEMKKAKPGVPAKWDMTTDVVVAGSGPSGMGAAVAAVDAGAQVLVFEKGDNYGGCGIICAGILQLEGGTRFQKEHGIKDSPELYYQRLTSPKAKDHHGMDPKIAWQMAQRFPEFLDWSEKHGVKYRSFQAEAVDSQHSGAWHHLSWPEPGEGAMMVPPNKDGYVTGAGLMIPLKNYFLEKGGKILMHHKVTDVIQDETGRAVGVVVEADGKTLNVRAKKGVILAAGSWKANKALRKLSDGRFSENMISTGDPFVTPDGSGIIAAMRAGGMLARDYSKATSCVRRKFGTAHYNFPMGSKWGAPGLSCAGARWVQLIFTNKDGDRFIRESTSGIWASGTTSTTPPWRNPSRSSGSSTTTKRRSASAGARSLRCAKKGLPLTRRRSRNSPKSPVRRTSSKRWRATTSSSTPRRTTTSENPPRC